MAKLPSDNTSIPNTIYSWGFHQTQNPLFMDYCARLHGLMREPFNRAFNYCDLGCGNAVSATTFAAAQPFASFYCVDINPQHIVNGKDIANRGNLKNIEFFECAFHELLDKNLPKMDYIALHGILSWVPESTHKDIIAIIKKLLNPDGLVYISYNILPAWSTLTPLQNFMKNIFDMISGKDDIEKVNNTMRFINFFMAQNAFYFNIPQVKQEIERLSQVDPHYILHEYLVEGWKPFYFHEVTQLANLAGLIYCGSTVIADNYWRKQIPTDYEQILTKIPATSSLIESFADYILNRRFRRDLFVPRNSKVLNKTEHFTNLFGDLIIGNPPIINWIKGEKAQRNTEVNHSECAKQILALATLGNKTITEIVEHPSLKSYARRETELTIEELLANNTLCLLIAKTRDINALESQIKPTLPAYNQTIIESNLSSGRNLPLASPILGNGVILNELSIILLYCICTYENNDIVNYTLTILNDHNIKLKKDDKLVTDINESLQLVKSYITLFNTHMVPYLYNYGIIDYK